MIFGCYSPNIWLYLYKYWAAMLLILCCILMLFVANRGCSWCELGCYSRWFTCSRTWFIAYLSDIHVDIGLLLMLIFINIYHLINSLNSWVNIGSYYKMVFYHLEQSSSWALTTHQHFHLTTFLESHHLSWVYFLITWFINSQNITKLINIFINSSCINYFHLNSTTHNSSRY